MREHESLASELGGDWLHLDGMLAWIDETDASGIEHFQRNLRQLAQWGYRVDRTSPEIAMRDLEPDLLIDRDRTSEVYVVPGEGWLEGVAFAHKLAHEAQRRFGATLVQERVVALIRDGSAVTGVGLADGRRILADIVVNAAGPDAAEVAAHADIKLELRRQPGALVVTAPLPVCIRHVIYPPGFHLRPEGGGRLLLGGDHYDGGVAEATIPTLDHPTCAMAVADLGRVVPTVPAACIEALRVGIRPMPADGHPIVGFESDAPGLYEIVTHSGITLSAIIARYVTEELTGTKVPELAPFRPDRFRTSTWAESLRNTERDEK